MKQKKIIIILVLIIILLISGGVTYFVMASKANQPPVFTYDPGDFFITNVADSKSLIKADVIIEVSNKETNKYLTANEFKVRDVVIKVLRSKTQEDIMSANVQSDIEKDVIDELARLYQLDGIEHIYFNEFVVQQ